MALGLVALLVFAPALDFLPASVRQHYRYNCRESLEILVGQILDDSKSEVRKHTLLSKERLQDAGRLWVDAIARGLAGDWIETGVWRGGTSLLAALIARASENVPECRQELTQSTMRTIWLADSFQGLPPATTLDERMGGISQMDPAGSFAVSIDAVAALFRRNGFEATSPGAGATLDEQERPSAFRELRSASGLTSVRLLKGWFNETLSKAPIGTLAVLRLDGDLYTSTMDAIVPLYPK